MLGACAVAICFAWLPVAVSVDASVGFRKNYGWAPENRADNTPLLDDYRQIRSFDLTSTGLFQEDLSLFPITDSGDGTTVNGFGFKRFGFSTSQDYMVTAQVTNNGRCPVYMTLIGFAKENHRDITGQSNDFWTTIDPNDKKFRQPWYKMHLGTAGTTTQSGIASQISENSGTLLNNWFSTLVTNGPRAGDFIVFDGKYVDGADSDSNSTQFTRLPVVLDSVTGTCGEMPASKMKFFALDVAHIQDTAKSTILSTDFPGAFDSNTYKGCLAGQAASVTVRLRYVDVNLFPRGIVSIPQPSDFAAITVPMPNLEPPRALAKGLSLSTDQSGLGLQYAGTVTVTRAADETRIKGYKVYSYSELGTKISKCAPGIPIATFDLTSSNSGCTATTCTVVIPQNAPKTYQEASAAVDCQKMIVVSFNEAGEDSFDFLSFVDVRPSAIFQDLGRVKSLADLEEFDEAESVQSFTSEEGEEEDHSWSSEQKFVFNDPVYSWSSSVDPEGGIWFHRGLTGRLDNVKTTNIATLERDEDIMGGAFNVPYHRWLFSPSSMSSWKVKLTSQQGYSTQFKTGLKGFAIAPLSFCITSSFNGSNYATPDTIKALAQASSTDDFLWFDFATPSGSTNTWAVTCNSVASDYQILVVVEKGFQARYALEFDYQDFFLETQESNGGLTKTYRGCVKNGQNRDFTINFPSGYAILDTQITSGIDVQGMYVSANGIATQAQFDAADSFQTGWSKRLTASKPCGSTDVSDDTGTWNVRVYKELTSSLPQTNVEFVLQLRLLPNVIVPLAAPSGAAVSFNPGSFELYLSSGVSHVFRFDVPPSQGMFITITLTRGKILFAALQSKSCPPEIVSDCTETATTQCFSDANSDQNNVLSLAIPDRLISSDASKWYLRVTARSPARDLSDEALITINYSFSEKAAPTPTPTPTLIPCSRFFSTFCSQGSFVESSASHSSTWVAMVIGFLVALAI